MIEVENPSKRYGEKLAAGGLDFVVRPGIVTGFLGPNGAGKPATMRMIAGRMSPPRAGSGSAAGSAVRPRRRWPSWASPRRCWVIPASV